MRETPHTHDVGKICSQREDSEMRQDLQARQRHLKEEGSQRQGFCQPSLSQQASKAVRETSHTHNVGKGGGEGSLVRWDLQTSQTTDGQSQGFSNHHHHNKPAEL